MGPSSPRPCAPPFFNPLKSLSKSLNRPATLLGHQRAEVGDHHMPPRLLLPLPTQDSDDLFG